MAVPPITTRVPYCTAAPTPPLAPVANDLWFDTVNGYLFIYYDDGNTKQWVVTDPSTSTANGPPGPPGVPGPQGPQGPPGSGGGSGGGDDLQTTPVGAIGSTVEQPMPNWLAGAPILVLTADIITLGGDHVGAWLHTTNNIGVALYLPDTWLAGWTVGVRQMGEGTVTWFAVGNSTLQIPFTRNSHTHVLEQYEEVIFRVVANSDGHHAIWAISGATG